MNFFDKLKGQLPFGIGKAAGKEINPVLPMRAKAQYRGQALQGPVEQGPGIRQVGGIQDASQMPSGMQFQRGLRVSNSSQFQPNMQPEYEDAYTPDLALNQTYTQGNPQLTRPGYSIQRGGNPQEDVLRKLLGY